MGKRTSGAQGPRLSRQMSRRLFLGGSSAGLAAAVLAACSGNRADSGSENIRIQWWDQFQPLNTTFEEELFAPYKAENPHVSIERRQMDSTSLGESLQVARRSNQLPDVHTLAGLDTSAAALVSNGWFQPIGQHADFENSPVADQILDGTHRFDGEIYSFPPFSPRWHEAVPWHNRAILEEAGVDPDETPRTWDDLREVARLVVNRTEAQGIAFPTQEATFAGDVITRFAQTAGAAGAIDWRTGEYAHDSQPFLDAIEFILSLQQDGLLHPASPAMAPHDAQARWTAGETAIFMTGAWFMGVLQDEGPDMMDSASCWSMPRAEEGQGFLYSGPSGGFWWMSRDSQHPEIAAELLLNMTSDSFQAALAEAMDQPPALLEAVEQANVHPAYQQCISHFAEDVKIAPSPDVGHPDAWQAIAQMQDIRPNVGDIVQAALAGEDVDIPTALRQYRDAMTAERDRAIEAARNDGAEVDLDSGWVFSNWDPESDYELEDYDAR